jgi:hypothetical protein
MSAIPANAGLVDARRRIGIIGDALIASGATVSASV